MQTVETRQEGQTARKESEPRRTINPFAGRDQRGPRPGPSLPDRVIPAFLSANRLDRAREEEIRSYHRAISLLLPDNEHPLIATICHAMLTRERIVVPTDSIRRALDKAGLPYTLINRNGRELNEWEILAIWEESR